MTQIEQEQNKQLFRFLEVNGYIAIPGDPDLPDRVVKQIAYTYGLKVDENTWGWETLRNSKWKCCVAWECSEFQLFVYVLIKGQWMGGIAGLHLGIKEMLQWFNGIATNELFG